MQDINYTRGYAEINLDAMKSNIMSLKSNIMKNKAEREQDVKLMLVIKADGYGHGSVKIGTTFSSQDDVWGFAVATLDEGILLRHSGIEKPILVLGCVFPEQYEEAIFYDIQMNVYTESMGIEIAKVAALMNRKAKVHIKIDTGMSRLGFLINQESIQAIERLGNLSHLVLEGIFTHFACADELGKEKTELQYSAFVDCIKRLEKSGITFAFKHCSNSAGIIEYPNYGMDIVRIGISLYGLYPSNEVSQDQVELQPVLSWKSTLASVKEIQPGMGVSYGGTFVADRKMRIGMVPIGYADGYARALSNKGYVLIHGKKANIIGRICMDQFMVDITNIEEAEFMSPVTLIGTSEKECITVEMLSEISERFNYEFVCCINKRIPRIYIKNGKTDDQIDYYA